MTRWGSREQGLNRGKRRQAKQYWLSWKKKQKRRDRLKKGEPMNTIYLFYTYALLFPWYILNEEIVSYCPPLHQSSKSLHGAINSVRMLNLVQDNTDYERARERERASERARDREKERERKRAKEIALQFLQINKKKKILPFP